MAKKAYCGIDSKARSAKKLYIGINNVARKVKKAYVGIDGKARLFYSSGVARGLYYVYGRPSLCTPACGQIDPSSMAIITTAALTNYPAGYDMGSVAGYPNKIYACDGILGYITRTNTIDNIDPITGAVLFTHAKGSNFSGSNRYSGICGTSVGAIRFAAEYKANSNPQYEILDPATFTVKSKPILGDAQEYNNLMGSGAGDWFYTMDCWDDSDGDEYAYFRRHCASTGAKLAGLSYNKYTPDVGDTAVGWDTIPYTITDDGTTIYTCRRGNAYLGKTWAFNNVIESVINTSAPGNGTLEIAFMT